MRGKMEKVMHEFKHGFAIWTWRKDIAGPQLVSVINGAFIAKCLANEINICI
jgi:hypothetical protein